MLFAYRAARIAGSIHFGLRWHPLTDRVNGLFDGDVVGSNSACGGIKNLHIARRAVARKADIRPRAEAARLRDWHVAELDIENVRVGKVT